jgi:drug/metabolite transporter (DMT)-like permease
MSIWSAIALALIATCCYQIGTVMQKLGADRMPRIGLGGGQRGVVRAFLRSPIWLGGLAVSTAGWVVFLKAIANAPVSIVQPVLGFGLCLLALFAVVFLHERLRPLEWLGVGLMVGGIVLLGISGAQERDRAPAVSYLALVAVSIAIVAVLGAAVQIARRGRRIPVPVVLGFASGGLIGLGAVYTKALFLSIGAGAVLVPWAILLPLVLAANIGGLWVMQAGFQQGRALIVVAMNAVTNKAITIVGAMATLGELLPADPTLAAARVLGFVTILAGTAMLARFSAVTATTEAPPAAEAA